MSGRRSEAFQWYDGEDDNLKQMPVTKKVVDKAYYCTVEWLVSSITTTVTSYLHPPNRLRLFHQSNQRFISAKLILTAVVKAVVFIPSGVESIMEDRYSSHY